MRCAGCEFQLLRRVSWSCLWRMISTWGRGVRAWGKVLVCKHPGLLPSLLAAASLPCLHPSITVHSLHPPMHSTQANNNAQNTNKQLPHTMYRSMGSSGCWMHSTASVTMSVSWSASV